MNNKDTKVARLFDWATKEEAPEDVDGAWRVIKFWIASKPRRASSNLEVVTEAKELEGTKTQSTCTESEMSTIAV